MKDFVFYRVGGLVFMAAAFVAPILAVVKGYGWLARREDTDSPGATLTLILSPVLLFSGAQVFNFPGRLRLRQLFN